MLYLLALVRTLVRHALRRPKSVARDSLPVLLRLQGENTTTAAAICWQYTDAYLLGEFPDSCENVSLRDCRVARIRLVTVKGSQKRGVPEHEYVLLSVIHVADGHVRPVGGMRVERMPVTDANVNPRHPGNVVVYGPDSEPPIPYRDKVLFDKYYGWLPLERVVVVVVVVVLRLDPLYRDQCYWMGCMLMDILNYSSPVRSSSSVKVPRYRQEGSESSEAKNATVTPKQAGSLRDFFHAVTACSLEHKDLNARLSDTANELKRTLGMPGIDFYTGSQVLPGSDIGGQPGHKSLEGTGRVGGMAEISAGVAYDED